MSLHGQHQVCPQGYSLRSLLYSQVLIHSYLMPGLPWGRQEQQGPSCPRGVSRAAGEADLRCMNTHNSPSNEGSWGP